MNLLSATIGMDHIRIAARISAGLSQPLSERPDYGTRQMVSQDDEKSDIPFLNGKLYSPSSLKDDMPLTEKQSQEAYDAGYEAASKAHSQGRPFYDPTDAFLWASKNDDRVPKVTEDDQSFWEWDYWVRKGAEDFNKSNNIKAPWLSDDDDIHLGSDQLTSGMQEQGVVRKTPGKGYCVKSEDNSDWSGGCYPTKGEAKKRLNQVEYFKHKGSSDRIPGDKIDIGKIASRIASASRQSTSHDDASESVSKTVAIEQNPISVTIKEFEWDHGDKRSFGSFRIVADTPHGELVGRGSIDSNNDADEETWTLGGKPISVKSPNLGIPHYYAGNDEMARFEKTKDTEIPEILSDWIVRHYGPV